MKSKDKLSRLKEEIDMNMVPNVVQAGGSPEYCFGDLVDIGYAEKLSEGTGQYTREECWRYTGPNSINTNWNGIMKQCSCIKQCQLQYLSLTLFFQYLKILKGQSHIEIQQVYEGIQWATSGHLFKLLCMFVKLGGSLIVDRV